MSHIQKRSRNGKTVWQVRVSTTRNGRRTYISRSFANRKDADRWRGSEAGLIEGRGITGGRESFGSFVRRWMSYIEQRGVLAPTSVESYRKHLVRLGGLLGNKPLAKITSYDIDDCYARLRAAPSRKGGHLSPLTLVSAHKALRRCLADAVRWRVLASNPASEAEPPPQVKSRARAPSVAEFERLLEAAAGTPWRLPILCAALTGLRRGEVLALRWCDVSFADQTLTVVRTAWEITGRHEIRATAKTSSSLRTLTVPSILIDEFKAHKLAQTEQRLSMGPLWQDSDLIFCQGDGRMWPPFAATQAVGRLKRAVGLPENVAPLHGLRHLNAVSMMAQRIDIKTISSRLGHSSVKVTGDVYLESVAALDRDAAEAAADLLLRGEQRGSTDGNVARLPKR
jgi:integrase